jgi:NAD(P)-dependent dehydrogenase (short-subunit alcohol dehydrogenase family)
VAVGAVATPFEFDISLEPACEALVASAMANWGAVHGLYNVAADLSQENLGRDGDVVTVPNEVLERTLAVNLIGYFYTSRYAIPAMLAGGGGSIVHTTSGVVRGHTRFAAYGAAKGGVIALSRHIATRWGKEGIRSNAIDPGITLTQNLRDMVSDEERQFISSFGSCSALRRPRGYCGDSGISPF